MHRLNVNRSCLGCHDLNQRDPKCAGCHAGIARTRCRIPMPVRPVIWRMRPGLPKAFNIPRRKFWQPCCLTPATPEPTRLLSRIYRKTVEVKTLVSQYGPVKLPHRKIVQTLSGNINDDELVRYFHRDKNTLCQGCHHHSPAAKKPPSCASCHGRPFDERDPFKPGLMAAYHRQCMECHKEMGIEKPVATNCTACHEKKG